MNVFFNLLFVFVWVIMTVLSPKLDVNDLMEKYVFWRFKLKGEKNTICFVKYVDQILLD